MILGERRRTALVVQRRFFADSLQGIQAAQPGKTATGVKSFGVRAGSPSNRGMSLIMIKNGEVLLHGARGSA
ncbi:MAG: hypothetical protein DBY45_10785 [Clostridiales bacterium]|nr:MAG: hypothetical protein DBY45_10785 [Clostridiales bacterium]